MSAQSNQEPNQEQSPEQHHLKAAELYEQAAKQHREALSNFGSGDYKTAAHHAHIAHGHAVQATEQAMEASKKYAKNNYLQQ